MRLPSPIVAGSIAIGVFAGGFAIGHFATEDNGSSKAAGKPQVLGQVFAHNPDETSTSATVATLAPVTTPETQAPTTATTAAPQASAGAKTVTVTPAAPASQPTSSPATTTVVVNSPD